MTQHNDPLRIGIFMDDFYPYSGGVARSIELQLNELVKAGHYVTLFAPKPFFDPPQLCDSEALDVWWIKGTPSFLCSLKFSDAQARRIAKKYKFDIVHSQNERGSAFLAARVAKLLDIPQVHTFHSNYAGTHRTSPFLSALNTLTYMQIAPKLIKRMRPDRQRGTVHNPRYLVVSERSRLAKWDWRAVAEFALYTDAFTSPAPFVIDTINDAARGTITQKSYVVPNGINPVFMHAKRIRQDEPITRFISCGRLDAEKRVDVIIEAFARLDRADTELYIVGSGTEEENLKKLARKLNPAGKIEFLGHYDDPERIANEYANADTFVMASYRFDTQGMVIAEAAASGAPILYCDDRLTIGISPQNSVLTHASASAMCEGMRAIANDPAARKRMSAASRALGPSLTARVMEERFVRCYRETLKSFTSTPR